MVQSVSQNRGEAGRFKPGQSGNPGGRPKGLARTTRELLGDDGLAIVEFWAHVMADEGARTPDRLEASRLLAERGWGKPPTYEPIEAADQESLPQEQVDEAVRRFEAEVVRLAARREQPALAPQSR